VKRSYATASIVTAERIVFNVKGNAYRLIVAVDFEKEICWINWIGDSSRLRRRRRQKKWTMKTELKPIRSKADYERSLAEVERLWGAKSGTLEGDRLDILATLTDAYEDAHYPMHPPDPVEPIKFRMEQQGLIGPSRGERSRTDSRRRTL
jgi:HTH-type transcriptional regulator/antitoxin HigA